MGSDEEKADNVEQALTLLRGMQQLRLVPADVKVTSDGVTLTGISHWEQPLDNLRDSAR